MGTCPYCGSRTFEPIKSTKSVKKRFWNEGAKDEAFFKVYNDAFYEITSPKNKGALVHIFDIIN